MNDELAQSDAESIVRFLQGRGYLSAVNEGQHCEPTPRPLLRDASSLSGVDMIEVRSIILFRAYLPFSMYIASFTRYARISHAFMIRFLVSQW